MIKFPPCKVNLGLQIVRKRKDGFHEIKSVMYPVPLTDMLEIVKSENFSFQSSGIPIPGDTDANLCIKAYQLMKERHGLSNVSIYLHKNIPMGGGLGGGSSDCAYTFLILNELFELKLSKEILQGYAAELGSDCPFFISNTAQLATGRGEVLSKVELDLKGKWMKLVNLDLHISTKEAYANAVFSGEDVAQIDFTQLESWKTSMQNDFETSAFAKFPELKEVKQKLYAEGAVYAAMTGSGSTMFGIYEQKPVISFEAVSFEKIVEL